MTILWTVNDRDGKALPLQDKEVHLYYTCERGRFEADFEIQKTNTVVWNFYGGLQKTLGTYSLTLEILHPDSKSSIKKDVCSAFCLVGKDCEADAKETTVNGEISVYQEVITTNLDIARIQPIIPQVVRDENGIGYWYVDGVNTGDRATGETAYEYAKSKGYEGTEDQFAEKLAEFPDWNVANSSEGGYIKGRTHGVTYEHVSVEGTLKELGYVLGEYVSVLHYARVNGVLEGKGLYLGGLLYNPIVGEEYRAKYEGPSVYARVVEVEDGYDVQIKGASDTGHLLKVAIVDYKRIDDAYIPDTILRVEDVDSALSTESENPVQNKVITAALSEKVDKGVLDWREDDKAGAGYVKGKTHFINDSALNECSLDANDYEVVYYDINEEEVVSHIVYKESLSPWDDVVIVAYYDSQIDTGAISLSSETKTATYLSDKYQVINPEEDGGVHVVAKLEYIYDDYGDIQERKLCLRLAYNDAYSANDILCFFERIKLGYAYDFGIKQLDEKFVPHTIARQESVDELREETTALWENLEDKADKDGVYSKMTVGRSIDLLGVEDVEEGSFVFRPTDGDGSIKDGVAVVKSVKGDSVVWNQLLRNEGESATINGVTITKVGKEWHCSGVATDDVWFLCSNRTEVIVGHKYLYQGCPNGGSTTTYMLWEASNYLNVDEGKGSISTANINGISPYIVIRKGVDATGLVYRPILRDLTQMFQAGNEPSTIEEYEARKPIVEDEYAYSEGEVVNMKATGIKSVGFNAWDEEWRQGYYVDGGLYVESPTQICSKNPIQVLPNESYCINQDFYYVWYYDKDMRYINHEVKYNKETFVTPSNAAYIHFNLEPPYGTTYKNDICINLVHSGYRNGEYEPYVEDVLDLPTLDLFPNGMNKIGDVYDEYDEEKSVQRMGSVDLGSLTWEVASNNRMIATSLENVIVRKDAANDTLLCAKYTSAYPSEVYLNSYDKIICSTNVGHIFVYDSAYTDAATFKAAMQGVILYYELAEPIVTPHKQRLVYKAWDFGTEQVIADGNTTAITAGITYEFNARDTIRGNKAKNEEQDKRMRILEGEVVRKGDYSPENKVGLADDLAGRGESVPAEFGFRASGGKSIKDGRAYIKSIKGNSVVWNQWVDTIATQDCDLSETDNRLTLTPQGGFPGVKNAISMNIVENHVYICISHRIGGGFLNINCGGFDGATNVPFRAEQGHHGFVVYSYSETQPFTITRPILIDLTKMFGDGYEPTTIEDFQSRVATLGIDLYAYNEGEVIHCNTESIKSVGDNAWDEQWENGTFNIISGEAIDGSWVMGQIRSKNPLPVLPNEEYYVSMGKGSIWVIFLDKEGNAIESPAHNGVTAGNAINISNSGRFKTPTNAAFLIFYCTDDYGNTYNHDILISLYHSGWKAQKDDQYQPYWQDTLPLPIIRKYFPDGMKLAGSAHDEIRFNKASGKWEYSKGKIKSVDLGNLEWATGNDSIFIAVLNDMNPALNTITGIMAKYNLCTSTNGSSMISGDDKTYITNGGAVGGAGRFTIKDTSYTDAATFKAAMAGVMLYYEAADWEWVELDEADQNFRDYYNVADFGTEQSQSNVPSAAFSADIIYQFNAVDMIREHELEITELQKVIETMQAQLASLTNS